MVQAMQATDRQCKMPLLLVMMIGAFIHTLKLIKGWLWKINRFYSPVFMENALHKHKNHPMEVDGRNSSLPDWKIQSLSLKVKQDFNLTISGNELPFWKYQFLSAKVIYTVEYCILINSIRSCQIWNRQVMHFFVLFF